jgi:hypothetical protein
MDRIVVGCNYHTKWQSVKSMRFVLAEVKDNKARLVTRNTKKDFWTNIDDLIFITTKHNIQKANQLEHGSKGIRSNH